MRYIENCCLIRLDKPKYKGTEESDAAENLTLEVVGVDLDSSLAAKEGEAVAQLKDEGLDLAQDGFFEIAVRS